MPELPEVETMRRGLEKIVGLRIHSVSFSSIQAFPSKIENASPFFGNHWDSEDRKTNCDRLQF